ncbi:hypothetical protein SORBI_3003G440100 [Sorghum bicolor]|uniref:EF-hand domain-containing protein n=1 Tax=Sorghum bicolor TaxID=4558 RepID=A0A1W0W1I1_SORBI|nr:hypothetical protein SORBI_3003G440100 [Sorghum bicolor]
MQSFVEDERAFNSCVDARFASLDADRDSRLSYAEMAGELMVLRVREAHFGSDAPASDTELAVLYRALFVRFNRDGHGAVDRHEFHAEMREYHAGSERGGRESGQCGGNGEEILGWKTMTVQTLERSKMEEGAGR